MKINGKTIFSALSIAVVLAVGFFAFNYNIEPVLAGNNHNVYGWAWSENIGWISFNNCGNNRPDIAPSAPDCADPELSGPNNINYGVSINPNTGEFSGYAWSENIGWIDFNPGGPFPDAMLDYSACVKLPNKTGPCDGLANYEVDGWVRATAAQEAGVNAGGWTGWIKLRGNIDPIGNYGVNIDPSTAPNPLEFHEWAWGGGGDSVNSAVIGWISFNSADPEAGGSAYKVMTTLGETGCPGGGPPPCLGDPGDIFSVTESAPGYCSIGSGGPHRLFSVVSENDGTVKLNFENTGTGRKFFVDITTNTGPFAVSLDDIDSWGVTYSWELDIDPSYNGSFSMPRYQPPSVNFTWDPLDIVVGELVTFNNLTNCHGSTCTYLWDIFGFNYSSGFDSTSINPEGDFPLSVPANATLTATNNEGDLCPGTKPLTGADTLPLPEWREVSPFRR